MSTDRCLRDPLNIVAVIFGLGWLVFALAGRPIGDYGVETDFYGDLRWARHWFEEGPTLMNGFRGPFYHLVLGGLTLLARDGFLVGKLISVLSAAVGLRVAGGLIRGLFGSPTAVGAVLYLAAVPLYAAHTFRACTDQFFWALFVTALALMFRDDDRPVRAWLWAGVAAGAAWLTRYNGAMLLPTAVIVAAFTLRPFTRAARALAVFGAGWLATASPWLIFVGKETGNPLWNNTHRLLASTIYGPSPNLAQQGELAGTVGFTSLWEVLRVDPGRALRVLPAQAWDHLQGDVTQLVGLPLATLALAGLLAGLGSRRRFKPRPLAFWLCGTVVFAGMLTVFYNPRFMLPLLVWWAAAAGGLLQFVADRAPGPRTDWKRPPVLAAVAILVLLVGWSSSRVVRESRDPGHVSSPADELLELARVTRQAGLAIGPHTPIAARKPHIGYCLDAPVIPIPAGGVAELRAAGAHYLLVSAIEARTFPMLAPLLQINEPDDSPPGLRLVATAMVAVDEKRARGGKLFAVEDPPAWSPPAPANPVMTRDVEPGLSRLDTLRLRLARWYVLWSPDPSVDSLVRLMSPAARRHPKVLVVKGDAALLKRDAVAAVRNYRQALLAEPDNSTIYMRLAGARLLSEPGQSARDLLNHPAAGLHELRADSTASWWTVAAPHITSGDYSAALAPLMACVEAAPGSAAYQRYLGISLMALTWHDQAAAAFRRCLELDPEDAYALDALRALETKRAQPSPVERR